MSSASWRAPDSGCRHLTRRLGYCDGGRADRGAGPPSTWVLGTTSYLEVSAPGARLEIGYVRNVRSQQAIARLGARYEGLLRRYQRRADGTVRDTALCSVTAEEWPAVRRGLEERL